MIPIPVKKKTTRKKSKTSSKPKSKGISNISISTDEPIDLKGICKSHKDSSKCNHTGSCSGITYFLGFIGATVYYISTATGFWNGCWGVIKALVWPAVLVFSLMKSLGM